MQPTMIEAAVSVVPAIVAMHALTRAAIDRDIALLRGCRTRQHPSPIVARDGHANITSPTLPLAARPSVRRRASGWIGRRAFVHRRNDTGGGLGRPHR